MKLRKTRFIFIIYAVLLAAAIITLLVLTLRKKEEEVVRVGFITTGSIEDAGWNAANYRCVQKACETMGAELVPVSGISEEGGECKSAVDGLKNKGVEMIILNSSVLADEMREYLPEYPNLCFYGADADYEAPNLSSYSSRMYQVRYLSGIVAGSYTKTGKIGFIAAYKDASACRGINAFALGVQSVNPDAEVIVAWTDDWDDEQKETELAKALIEKENADLLTYHQHIPYVIDIAEACGIASIGYYEPVENASDKYLTCAMCDWTVVYEKMIRGYMSGQGNATKSEWIGVESGAVTLSGFSPLVTKETVDKVSEANAKLIEGWHIFSEEIRDNEGNERCGAGESISDNTLLYEMDWLAEGVREYAE